MICPFGETRPMVNSLPVMNSSTSTWLSSRKAFSMAAPNSSDGAFTRDIPILEPPLLGLTKTGKLSWAVDLLGVFKLTLDQQYRSGYVNPIEGSDRYRKSFVEGNGRYRRIAAGIRQVQQVKIA